MIKSEDGEITTITVLGAVKGRQGKYTGIKMRK